MESAVGIFFSTQNGNVASSAVASTPSEQLQAILGPNVSAARVEALLRDAGSDVQAAVNLHYQREGQDMLPSNPCPLLCCTSISPVMALYYTCDHHTWLCNRPECKPLLGLRRRCFFDSFTYFVTHPQALLCMRLQRWALQLLCRASAVQKKMRREEKRLLHPAGSPGDGMHAAREA